LLWVWSQAYILGLDPDVVHESAELLIDIYADVQH